MMNITAHQDDSRGSGGASLVDEQRQAERSPIEFQRPMPMPAASVFERRGRRFRSLLGQDPQLVAFPFAFTAAMVILAGFLLAAWGITVSGAAIFLSGVIVMLLGLLLYGRSLCVEDS